MHTNPKLWGSQHCSFDVHLVQIQFALNESMFGVGHMRQSSINRLDTTAVVFTKNKTRIGFGEPIRPRDPLLLPDKRHVATAAVAARGRDCGAANPA